jgi:hypothetical protein
MVKVKDISAHMLMLPGILGDNLCRRVCSSGMVQHLFQAGAAHDDTYPQ